MGPKIPEYLFDLIKLSILSAEGNREAMASVIEDAFQKGADIREVRKAMFRAEKMAQRTQADQEAAIRKGIESLTANRSESRSVLPVSIKILTSKKAI